MDHDNGDYDPWERERYAISHARARLAEATPEQMRNAIAAGLNETTRLIRAYERHTQAEWLFQRVRGATDIIDAINRRLDA
jgi:hypothetical protein